MLAVGKCLKEALLLPAYFHTPLASAVFGYATHLSGIALHRDTLQYVPGNISVSEGLFTAIINDGLCFFDDCL